MRLIIVIWFWQYPARNQILESRSCLGLSICHFVRMSGFVQRIFWQRSWELPARHSMSVSIPNQTTADWRSVHLCIKGKLSYIHYKCNGTCRVKVFSLTFWTFINDVFCLGRHQLIMQTLLFNIHNISQGSYLMRCRAYHLIRWPTITCPSGTKSLDLVICIT